MIVRTVDVLREFVVEALRGSYPDESYDHELFDDPANDEEGKFVDKKTLDKTREWARSMGLSRRQAPRRARRGNR